MAIKDTIKKMHTLLNQLSKDLIKAEKGNKAAAQRTRTGSIKFGKIAKQYRKESVQAHKNANKKKASSRKRKKPMPKKATSKKKTYATRSSHKPSSRRKTKWASSSSQHRRRA